MNGRVVFFTNPISQGVKRKGSRLEAFHSTNPHNDHSLLSAKSVTETSAAFKALAFTPQDHLLIEGGDGTMQRTLSCLLAALPSLDHCPKLSLIAGGLTNQIAANVGLKSTKPSYIKAAIATPDKGLRPTPILKLTHSGTDHTPHYGCLFSSGALPFVTEYYTEKVRASQTGGKAAIAATLVKAVSGNQAARDALMPATEISLRLETSNGARTKTGAHLGTVVTTLPSLMMGLDPFWGESSQVDAGDLRVFYADARARRLVRNLTGLWLGRKTIDRSGDGLESFQATQLDYHYDGPIVLDGERLDLGSPFSVTATQPLPFVVTPK